jgi:flagellar basal body rod protein FlgG
VKYLFFDLEFANSRDGKPKICEFGYVVTDEGFRVLSRGNLIIDPNIQRS